MERDERTKRPAKPTQRIQEILNLRAELEEKKRRLIELKVDKERLKLQRDAEREAKRVRREEQLNQLPLDAQAAQSVSINFTQGSTTSSVASELGLIRTELQNAGEILSRQEITGGSDLSMMAKLHGHRPDPDSIGELPECICWLCGFPMLTKKEYEGNTVMIKRVHGQVSPEHTLPVSAGNALIGLPTKEFYDAYKYKHKSTGYKETIEFFKKGLTYSHFWCNEVKNALRLVSWRERELPRPNDDNIRWLLRAMWNGIDRPRGNRWFDQSACFVVYRSPAGVSYKFSNLVHFFVLKDKVGVSSAEISIRDAGDEWKRNRFTEIKRFLSGICDDIKRYTQMYCGETPTNEELFAKLQEIYRDRVVNGIHSQFIWPPVLGLSPGKSSRDTTSRFKNSRVKSKKSASSRQTQSLRGRGAKSLSRQSLRGRGAKSLSRQSQGRGGRGGRFSKKKGKE
jgi:hypothetical protein